MIKAEKYKLIVDNFLAEHLEKRAAGLPHRAQALLASARYSVFTGGKRFRPLVCYLAAEALDCAVDRVTPFASALELVHTYSLIHDDLPLMDDDDFRRGQPTNHRVYGEALALLAGDSLLTEAFYILAEKYQAVPEIGLELTKILSEAAGLTGMVAGQVMDMSAQEDSAKLTIAELIKLHELKTGALIQSACDGVAVIVRAPKDQRIHLRQFGALLGLAFQLTDDVLDFDPKNLEASGFPKLVGIEETKKLLKKTTESARRELSLFGEKAQGLLRLLDYNLTRDK